MDTAFSSTRVTSVKSQQHYWQGVQDKAIRSDLDPMKNDSKSHSVSKLMSFIHTKRNDWLKFIKKKAGSSPGWIKKHVSVISRLWYNTCKEGILLTDQISTKSFCIEKFPPGFPRPTVKGDIQLLGIEVQRKRRKNEMSIKIQKCWRFVLTYIWNIYDVNSIFLPYYAFMMTLRKTLLNSIEFSKY